MEETNDSNLWESVHEESLRAMVSSAQLKHDGILTILQGNVKFCSLIAVVVISHDMFICSNLVSFAIHGKEYILESRQ